MQFSPLPRVLDLDGSLRVQRDFLCESNATTSPLESFGPLLRYICRREDRQRFERRLNIRDARRLTFFGSGDFHHLTFSLLKQFREPMSVVLFDQHPDWDVTSPFPCCGTWVNDALRLPHIERVIVLGAGDEDLGGGQLWRGNRAALRSGRLEIYPATLETSLWPGIGTFEIACGKRRRGRFLWKTLKEQGLSAILDDVLARLPTKRLYISVDKDCLQSQFARSNWDAGELELADVCAAIERLRTQCELVGADITGEWSAPRFCRAWVRAVSQADHPKQEAPSREELEINARTNLVLWRAFGGASTK